MILEEQSIPISNGTNLNKANWTQFISKCLFLFSFNKIRVNIYNAAILIQFTEWVECAKN